MYRLVEEQSLTLKQQYKPMSRWSTDTLIKASATCICWLSGTVNFKQVTSCLSTKYWPTVDQFIDCLLIEVTYIKYDSNILGSKYALPLPLDFAPGLTIQMFFVPSMSI